MSKDPLMKYLAGNDLSAFYNTPLNPVDEALYQFYAANPYANPFRRDIRGDQYDYDTRGYWQSANSPDGRCHASDQFKKPNHPTFSQESQYHGSLGNMGGQWVEDGYIPSAQQASPANMEFLSQYFRRVEPNMKLHSPGYLATLIGGKK